MRIVRGLIVPLALLVAIGALALRAPHEARGLSFNPHLGASLADSSPGAASDINLDFSIDAPDPNFEAIVTFLPSEMYIAPDDDVPNGAVAGTLEATATLGLFNGDCNTLLPVHFDLIEATTDIHNLIPLYSGYQDFDSNGLPENVDRYPEFITRLAPNLRPIERLYGQTLVAGVQTFVNFVVFEPGTKIARLPEMDASLGYPIVVYLNDPTSPSIPFAITDFCTPLGTDTTIFGTSQDNPDTTGDESGTTLKRNPQSAGAYNAVSFVRSQWDADGDGFENTIDPCPFTLDPGWNPRGGGSPAADADADGLPNSCDPSPNDANSNEDNDNYQNKQDSCPLVSQDYYAADYDHDGIGDACDSLPEDPSQGGVAQRAEVCLVSEFNVGGGGSAPDVVCPSGPDVVPALVFHLDAQSVLGLGAENDVSALLADPITGIPVTEGTLHFEVMGANPTSGSCDLKLACIFTYTGHNLGVDTITASATIDGEDVSKSVTTEWLTPPANDGFATGQFIDALPFKDSKVLASSTGEAAEPDVCAPTRHTIWYKFTPQSDVFVKTEATVIDDNYAGLGLFVGGSVFGLTRVDCGYHNYPPINHSVSVAKTSSEETYLFASLVAGQTYFLQVGGYSFVGRADVTVEVEEAIRGDANCDGTSDGLDVLAMLKFDLGLGQADCYGAADFDCYNFPSVKDILSTLKMQLGIPVARVCPS